MVCAAGQTTYGFSPSGALLNKSEMTLPSRDREGASHESDKR